MTPETTPLIQGGCAERGPDLTFVRLVVRGAGGQRRLLIG